MRPIKPLKIASALLSLLLLSGCGGGETHVSFGGKEGGQPVFCISAKPNCAAPGVALRTLEVDQIDETGNIVRVMWQIESPGGWGSIYTVDKITYGTLPIGWTTKAPPVPLTYGRHYRVNKQYNFSITANGLVMDETRQ